MDAPLPVSRDLVLIGGGHSHALVLRMWGMNPLPGARVTVINPGPTAPYSGMLPGHLAGHYKREALDIDLVRLARFAGARVVLGAVEGIDLHNRQVHVPGRPPIGFDIASVDVGITSEMPSLEGFETHGVPAKPLATFARRWREFRDGDGQAEVAVIGGGVAGVEIALALSHALKQDGRPAGVTLLDRGEILSGLPSRSARALRRALARFEITVEENTTIRRVDPRGVHLADGRILAAQFVTGAAGARPQDWIAETGLALDQGFIEVDQYLRTSDPAIFAVGDCAQMVRSPRPKAGVYAVRQAPVLFKNLRRALMEKGAMTAYSPQKDYLKLISLGEKSALADRFGVTLSGPLMWRWKDYIDRKFMDQFKELPEMSAAAVPADHAAGMKETMGPKPMCGGCGSKVGRDALGRALSGLPALRRRDVEQVAGDDAATIVFGQTRQVISTDHLRAFCEDPVVMARIAATHALGDIWAMGAAPQAATTSVILPRMSSVLAERSLSEIMQAAQEVFAGAGAEILGGHSSLGAELTIGFTVTGLCSGAPITLAGARPGDKVLLTKPIGSGVLMAAEMARAAKGEWVAEALDLMAQSQARAAKILCGATAMTDVTGFGLVGHLTNICEASQVGAKLLANEVPFMPGALELAQEGIRSSLFPGNKTILPHVEETPRLDLLFDPQTAGGLLATVPGAHAPLIAALQDAGFGAAMIGEITETEGQIAIV